MSVKRKQHEPSISELAARYDLDRAEAADRENGKVDPRVEEALSGNRTLSHAIAVMADKPTPPRIVDGKVERSEPTKREALDQIAQALIKAGKLKADDYDPAFSELAAEINRERGFNGDAESDESVFSKDALITALAKAVLDRRRR